MQRISDISPEHPEWGGGPNLVRTPRVVRDARSGEMMTVMERRAEGTAGARRPTCLIFSNDRGFTRLWDYPENWADLSDEELFALSEFRSSRTA